MSKLWGGRFEKETHHLVEKYTESLSVDARLWEVDIDGSLAHLAMLSNQGILSSEAASQIRAALLEIQSDLRLGKVQFQENAEDVHSEVERLLKEKVGPLAGMLHTARSRNDQVITDTKLYLRKEAKEILRELKLLQSWILDFSEKNLETILPGLTHTQHAQPVSLAHHFMAYFWMLERDAGRLKDCLGRADECPLGAGALAGTSFPIDRNQVSVNLHFSKATENSLDTVSDRDYVIEFLSFASMTMMHLSRLSEELIWWSTPEFGYVSLDDSVTTGSSMMPQKKNPDVAELMRGKVGRVYGGLIGSLTMMKALPLSYNRDMQEDKTFLFDGMDTVRMSLKLMRLMLETAKFHPEKMKASLKGDFSNATDLADDLVEKGMPFREAHEVAGRIVMHCIPLKKGIEDLSLSELLGFSRLFDEKTLVKVQHENVMKARLSLGGTSSLRVAEQILKARDCLG
jgi:argininosuccinate lyase